MLKGKHASGKQVITQQAATPITYPFRVIVACSSRIPFYLSLFLISLRQALSLSLKNLLVYAENITPRSIYIVLAEQ